MGQNEEYHNVRVLRPMIHYDPIDFGISTKKEGILDRRVNTINKSHSVPINRVPSIKLELMANN